jgi:hypothetical protein
VLTRRTDSGDVRPVRDGRAALCDARCRPRPNEAMADDSIPGVVRQLIAERLDSIPELEAVLLFREDGTRHWTPDEAGRRLYVSTTVATYILEQLSDRGFLVRVGDQYRYEPRSENLADAVDQLASAYSRHLVAVTHLVHSKPGQGVRDFADAFRLRRPR